MEDGKTSKNENLPIFPDIIPDSIVKTQQYKLIADDFVDEEIIDELLSLMYDHPECNFFLYLQHKGTYNGSITDRLSANGVLSNKTESFYYPHPKFERSFVRLKEPFEFEWEKEVVEKGPMFFRITLKLSEGKRKEIDRSLIVQELKKSDNNPIQFNPSIYGVGFKGPQLWRWLKKKLRI